MKFKRIFKGFLFTLLTIALGIFLMNDIIKFHLNYFTISFILALSMVCGILYEKLSNSWMGL